MIFLILGCGSIGRRHANALLAINQSLILVDKYIENVDIDSHQILFKTNDIDLAFKNFQIDCVLICTPTHLHLSQLNLLLDRQVSVFIEKPISTTYSEDLQQLNYIEETLKKNRIVTMMGHTYRFRNQFREVKQFIDRKVLGIIYSAEFSGGWFLPDWHKDKNYMDEYAANKSMGGGVNLTSMSHFFDLIYWYFGSYEIISSVGFNSKLINVDVDDIYTGIYKSNHTVITFYEDFLSRIPRRNLRLNCQNGVVEFDFNKNIILSWDVSKRHYESRFSDITIVPDGVGYDPLYNKTKLSSEYNDPYIDQMKYLVNIVDNNIYEHELDFRSGVNVLDSLKVVNIHENL
jgi:predicted dehydrogenase